VGKSSKPTIGYRHYMGLYMGESHGPNDYLAAVEIGGEMAWEGQFDGSGTIQIDKPHLFGGDKREGGIVGPLTVRQGEPTQMPDAYLQSQVAGPWPAARGLCTTVFNGQVGAMNPYLKLFKKRWGRFVAGWSTPVWHPELVKVGRGMNPMHIIYQCMTDTEWGLGWSTDMIDEASFLAAAQTLFDEGFTLCIPYRRSMPIGDYIAIINNHVAGQWAHDPRTNRITYRLIRNDYDLDDLPLIDETNIIKVEEWKQALLDGSTNEVTIVGRDPVTNKDIAQTYQNLANIQAQGRVIAEKKQFPGLWNLDLVSRVAARECAAVSLLPTRIRLTVKSTLWGIKRGDVYALGYARRGIARMAVRVLEVDEGTQTDSKIGLVLTSDVSGMAQSSYIKPSVSAWVAPDTAPKPLPAQDMYEASYRDLAASRSAAELAAIEADAGFLVTLGARPSGPAYNYVVTTRIGSGAFADVTSGDFSANGVLASAIGKTDTAIVLQGGRDLDLVRIGGQVKIGNEFCRLDAINPTTGAATIARGCVDTVPAAHAAGARVWFTDTYAGALPTEYTDGVTVDAKLLCRTQRGTLDPSLATTLTVTMDQRQSRPYPPGRVRVAAAPAPSSVAGAFDATWAHRNHVVQADQLIDTQAASIAPASDQRYGLRILNDALVVLVARSDIAGTTATIALAYTGNVTLELYAINSAGESLQRHVLTFAYTAAPGATTNTITASTWTPVITVIDGGEVTP
jgi:hypothetical protein